MTTFQELATAMLTCEQTKTQTVYQHGVSVREHVIDLINESSDIAWKIPSWLSKYRTNILSNLHKQDIIDAYTMYHDCGKPYCRTVDADGKVHFPNHAEVSKQKFLEAGGDPVVAELIGWDMVLHTATSEEIQKYLDEVWTVQDAITLLVVGLAEIHSNARLFGGTDSISFKSKFKTLERRGKQICKHFWGE